MHADLTDYIGDYTASEYYALLDPALPVPEGVPEGVPWM